MPSETSRAWAPSCRSRSIRRSSAAEASTTWERDSLRRPTWAAISFLVGASRNAATWAWAFSSRGPPATPARNMADEEASSWRW